jgi:hypothetical protein
MATLAKLGRTNTASTNFDMATGMKYVSRFEVVSACTLCDMYVYIRTPSVPNGSIKGVVYADNTGVPGALLYTTEATALANFTTKWYQLRFPPSSTLGLAVGYYHLGIITSATGVCSLRTEASTGDSNKNTDSWATGPTDPFGTPDDPQPTGEAAVYVNVLYEGINLTKGVAYAVVSAPHELMLSKGVAYAAIRSPYSVMVNKAVAFVVVGPTSLDAVETARPFVHIF